MHSGKNVFIEEHEGGRGQKTGVRGQESGDRRQEKTLNYHESHG